MRIKENIQRFLFCILTLPSFSLAAENAVLAQAREYVEAARGLVADVVVTDMEMIKDQTSLGTMQLKERIVGWQDGTPLRSIFSNSNPEHEDVAKTRFKILIENNPEFSLRDGRVLNSFDAVLDGKRCVVYEREQKQTGSVTVRSKIWVEVATGVPLKTVHDFVGIPMTKSLTHTITFTRPEGGKVLPLTLDVDATVSALFQSMRIVSKYRFVSWRKRASEPARGVSIQNPGL